jgi:hypothetical protein
MSEPLNYSYHFEEGDQDFERHGFGGIWGGQHSSMHHNLFAHCNNRTPRWNGSRYTHPAGFENCDFRNNVIYDWGQNNVYAGEGGNYNIVNNYYKYGPATNEKVRFQVLNPYKLTTGTNPLPYGKFYLTGNYVDGSPAITSHNWSGVVMNAGTPADTVLSKVAAPFNLGPVATQSAHEAYEAVLRGAGAVLPKRDALDQRIINDVRNRTGGLIDVQGGFPHGTPYSQSQKAWPVLKSRPAPNDTDHDGMPDAWERAHKLNPKSAADRSKLGAEGYTMLELYLNELAAPDAAAQSGQAAKPRG